jgi:hypothetical protein
MANVWAIHSVGTSIVTALRNAYPQQIGDEAMPACAFDLVSSGQLAGEQDEATRITLYLYRITVDEHSRQSRRAGAATGTPAPLHLDLHYLVSAWAANPLDEQVAMAWTMRQLHRQPVLDLSVLSPEGGWERDETVHVLPAELTTEDVMRIWDALDPAYRLSTSYGARVVRLDPDEDDELFAPVVARRLALGEAVAPGAGGAP